MDLRTARAAIKPFDTTGDGKLQYAEFLAGIKSKWSSAGPALPGFAPGAGGASGVAQGGGAGGPETAGSAAAAAAAAGPDETDETDLGKWAREDGAKEARPENAAGGQARAATEAEPAGPGAAPGAGEGHGKEKKKVHKTHAAHEAARAQGLKPVKLKGRHGRGSAPMSIKYCTPGEVFPRLCRVRTYSAALYANSSHLQSKTAKTKRPLHGSIFAQQNNSNCHRAWSL